MSMWLHLTQLDPPLYQHAITHPEHFATLVYGDDEGGELGPLDAVDEDEDVFGTDYRTIHMLLEEQYGEDFEDDPEAQADPFYRIAHGDGEIAAIEFNYGPGFGFSPATVASLAKDLAEFADTDAGDLSELARFFARAAKRGRHVIGGVD
ncbi:hypothetical protein ACNOYE_03935 [Nannocystaceae bacterium ST9]